LSLRLNVSLRLTGQINVFLFLVRHFGGELASGAGGKSLCDLEFGGGGEAEIGSRRLRAFGKEWGASVWGAFVRRMACG
jgi:hypothetical protein